MADLGCLKAFRSILILLQESFALPLASNATLVLLVLLALASLVELTLSIKVASLSSSSSSLPLFPSDGPTGPRNAAFFNALTQGHTFGFQTCHFDLQRYQLRFSGCECAARVPVAIATEPRVYILFEFLFAACGRRWNNRC
jgi:hypothetical protein